MPSRTLSILSVADYDMELDFNTEPGFTPVEHVFTVKTGTSTP